MATSIVELAEMAAKRANPQGETTTQMERRMRMEKAKRDAEKRVMPSVGPDEFPEDMIERRAAEKAYNEAESMTKRKKGGKVKAYAKGGYVKAADGCAQRGKTKGRFV